MVIPIVHLGIVIVNVLGDVMLNNVYIFIYIKDLQWYTIPYILLKNIWHSMVRDVMIRFRYLFKCRENCYS